MTLRILIVTGIFPPDVGGPATYVPRMAKSLLDKGHSVEVVCLSDNVSHDDSEYHFEVTRILRSQPKIVRIAQSLQAIRGAGLSSDVIFSNGLFAECAVAARMIRKPLVMKVVGDWAWERCINLGRTESTLDDFQCDGSGSRVRILKWIRTKFTRQADVIFTPSAYLREIVAGWGIQQERLHVIYNAPTDLPVNSPARLPAFRGRTVVTVARLVYWKGIDRLLRIVASSANVRLLIVGDGPQRNELESLASSLQMGEKAIFTGSVDPTEVSSYLRVADLFILNSTLVEGLPNAILEAMQVGVPVIATDIGGTREIIEHDVNGYLMPPKDDAKLKQAIESLLANPSVMKRISTSAKKTLGEKFSWERTLYETERLLLQSASMSL